MIRRPPRSTLFPTRRSSDLAHDMVREARLQLALAPQGIRLPTIRAVCEDESVLGVPFYVMDYLDGEVIGERLPPSLGQAERRRVAEDVADALVEIHAADGSNTALAAVAL